MNESQPTDNATRVRELVDLAYSFNHQHDDDKALSTIEQALALAPESEELLQHKANFLWNVCTEDNPERFLLFCNDCLERKVGNELYFRFHRAQVLHDMGTRWDSGKAVVTDRTKCIEAISELNKLKMLATNLNTLVEENDWIPLGWEEHFGGLMGFSEFHETLSPE